MVCTYFYTYSLHVRISSPPSNTQFPFTLLHPASPRPPPRPSHFLAADADPPHERVPVGHQRGRRGRRLQGQAREGAAPCGNEGCGTTRGRGGVFPRKGGGRAGTAPTHRGGREVGKRVVVLLRVCLCVSACAHGFLRDGSSFLCTSRVWWNLATLGLCAKCFFFQKGLVLRGWLYLSVCLHATPRLADSSRGFGTSTSRNV